MVNTLIAANGEGHLAEAYRSHPSHRRMSWPWPETADEENAEVQTGDGQRQGSITVPEGCTLETASGRPLIVDGQRGANGKEMSERAGTGLERCVNFPSPSPGSRSCPPSCSLVWSLWWSALPFPSWRVSGIRFSGNFKSGTDIVFSNRVQNLQP